MTEHYTVVKRLNDELIGVESVQFGRQLWTLGKMRRCSGVSCVICGAKVKKMAFRPITNRNNRRRRMCQACGSGGQP